ncbi:MAG: DUF3298 and DUF4163 domain-containing protein [Acetatifactor sp.]|nr:DUF3298 and DUF4163 domain-containing protein [Acetatifactor sp.]
MKHMAEAKSRYEDIPIPEELSERVMAEVEKAQIRYRKKTAGKRRRTFMKGGMAAAAAAVVLFTAGVNTSEVLARELQDVPVLGTMARILTFRSYESETEDLKISVDIPSVEMISDELSGMEDAVNEEIHMFCQEYADAAVERAEDYRQAFLDTGGTEEEWEAHHIAIKVWYEVKSQTGRYLSLAVMGSENWTSAYSETRYYNFDQEAGKWITLEDVLGKDYARIAEQSVRRQIEQRQTEDGVEYWLDEWEGIDEDTGFYMNSAGNPVIVFEQYEIAPGAMGMPEFEIVMSGEQ